MMPKPPSDFVIETLQRYGLELETACWDCHGQWVIYHKSCQIIAAQAGITFDEPQIVVSDPEKKVVILLVKGYLTDDDSTIMEWSFGECAPYNNRNNYPYAMAEKRGKDRVILTLAGLHGYLYSDIESEDFTPEKNDTLVPAVVSKEEEQPAKQKRDYIKELEQSLVKAGCASVDDATAVLTYAYGGEATSMDDCRENPDVAKLAVLSLQEAHNNGVGLEGILEKAKESLTSGGDDGDNNQEATGVDGGEEGESRGGDEESVGHAAAQLALEEEDEDGDDFF
jgi:hypothetical protein